MVDILDMEDIFNKILTEEFFLPLTMSYNINKKLIREVEAFVENKKEIACNNCEYNQEDCYCETHRIMVEDRD